MPDVTVVYWRDIPAQIIVGRGRAGAKVQLSERFEKAIDRAAMSAGLADTDAYLSEWRRDVMTTAFDAHDPARIAQLAADRIETEYDAARLRALIDNGGRA